LVPGGHDSEAKYGVGKIVYMEKIPGLIACSLQFDTLSTPSKLAIQFPNEQPLLQGPEQRENPANHTADPVALCIFVGQHFAKQLVVPVG
jgi:hypothetical protein